MRKGLSDFSCCLSVLSHSTLRAKSAIKDSQWMIFRRKDMDPYWERLKVTERPQSSLAEDNLIWRRLRITRTISQPGVREDINVGKEE